MVMTDPKPARTRAPRPSRDDPAAAVLGVVDTAAVAARFGVSPAAVAMWRTHGHGPRQLREPAGVLNGGLVWAEAQLEEALAERSRPQDH